MASPSRGHEKRGTQSECLPVSTAGNLARSKSGTWVDSSKPCLQNVWKAQRLTKKWKECTVIKEHRWGETTQQSLFARSDLWFSWKSKSYRMNSRRYRACFVVPWNEYTAQPAFLRLFCIGRRDGDEEKAPFLQGREVHMMNRKHYLHILGTAVVATLCSITNNFSGGGRCSRGAVCFRCSGIWTGRNHCRSETPGLGIQTLSRYRHGHSSGRI